jgi:hypothetical protein
VPSGYAGPTADTLLATVGLWVVFAPAVWSLNVLLDDPIPAGAIPALVAVVAVGGSYPFVAGDWSYDRLWSAVAALVGSILLLAILGMVVVVGFGLELSGTDPLPQAVVFVAAYPLAYLLIRRRRGAVQ